MAELYARHGMSMGTQMLVGCLPLLLTMPFLIAFYRVLQVSIELRGARFLWIPDLSQKDPLFLTPVLMGVSMFVMQKMMPTAMDPAQQRIMMIMPVVLSVMFLWAPAGLNLYWLASNVCSIVQQGITMSPAGAGAGPGAASASGRADEGPDLQRRQHRGGAGAGRAALGLPREALRYVVLEPGRRAPAASRRTPARIAVLHDDPEKARVSAAGGRGPRPAGGGGAAPARDPRGARGRPRRLPGAGGAGGRGGGPARAPRRPGPPRLLGGDGEALAALDHLLRRILRPRGTRPRLIVWCEGWRERRDDALRERALELARAVREDGQPRRLEPLNSYERRIVHVAVAELAGLTTFSVGEGHERRVTIAPGRKADPS